MKGLGKVYKETEAMSDTFQRLPVGGYVLKITDVKDMTEKEYLNIIYDIAEGEYRNFYSDDWGREHPQVHSFVMSYKEKAMGMFKGRLKAIDESNGTTFEQDAVKGLNEYMLIGKLVGAVIGEEEYMSDRGEVRTSLKVRNVIPVERVRKGDFKIPEVKKLKELDNSKKTAPVDGFSPLNDVDIPF